MRGASACLAAMAVAWAVVPGLHVLVHRREAIEDELHRAAEAARRRAHQRAAARRLAALARGVLPVDADRAPGAGDHPASPRHPGHPHDHGDPSGGGSPLQHGQNAPEHLGVALLESEPPALPVPAEAVHTAAPTDPTTIPRAAARRRAHGSRAPPAEPAPPRFT